MKSHTLIAPVCLAAVVATASAAPAPTAPPSKTVIAMSGSHYQILKDCAPFFIQGAQGSDRLDELAAAGANCVLARDIASAQEVLDKARSAGISAAVQVKLEVEGALTYTDEQAVTAALERIRAQVQKLKAHPALVLWVIRSNIFGSSGENPAAYAAVNRLARMLHEEDPNHAVALDVGVPGDQHIKARLAWEHCPEVDVLGITAEQAAVSPAAAIRAAGWKKPFVVFRLGGPVLESAQRTTWGALLEPASSAKAAHILTLYSNAVLAADGSCLGSFAFSWDPSGVGTPTWFSLRLADGARADVVDALTLAWSGRYPTNRGPDVLSVTSALNGAVVRPGSTVSASVSAADPEGDALSYRWELMKEVRGSDPAWFTAGEFKRIDGAVQHADQADASVGVPSEPGAYRLFVYVYDGKGHFSSASMPFLVESPTAEMAAAPAVGEVVRTPVPAAPAAVSGRPGHVEVHQGPGDSWQLVVDGKPFMIRGAGGWRNLGELKASGGNAIRTWSTDMAQSILDEAQKYDLKVCLGLWMKQERHGFNYSDPDAVAAQLEKLRSAVRRLRTHPALLMWCCGIEVEWGPGTNVAVYRAINDVAKMCHQEDPNHPTTTAFADLGYNNIKVTLATRYGPELDIFGVNSYGGLPSMADRLRAMGWSKPYLIMEFGPKGQWEVPSTEWGAEIEQSPMEKAQFYLNSYRKSVSSQEDWCLGSFCFSWDYKFEVTPTWYSMHLRDGLRANPCDTMCYAWSLRTWTNRCPEIKSAITRLDRKKVPPNQVFDIQVDASDPEGDPLRYEWVLMSESKKKQKDGTTATELKPIGGRITDAAAGRTQVRTPMDQGAYRLFIYTYDGKGNASSANMPFFVEKPKTP